MLTAVDKGYTPAPRSLTFGEYAASWLEIRSRHVRPITANAYRPYVNHAVRAFGARRLADISRADDERLAAALDTAGRSRRTTGMLLYVVRAIFAAALDDGCVTRNPATKVQPSGRAAAPRSAFGAADLGTLRAHAAMDRLHAYWLLTLAGLRRSEVLGLRWSDVDMTAGPVTIRGVVAGPVRPLGRRDSAEDHPGRPHSTGTRRHSGCAADAAGRPGGHVRSPADPHRLARRG
jgi:integrase